MSEHLKNRLIDVTTVAAVALIFWAVYSGYVLAGAVRTFYAGQCGIIQEQALEKAVADELEKRGTTPPEDAELPPG